MNEATERFDREFHLAWRQRLEQRPRGVVQKSDADERRYAVHMADLCVDRGYLNLAQAYVVMARDCPKGCGCEGCLSTAADVRESSERRRRTNGARRAAA